MWRELTSSSDVIEITRNLSRWLVVHQHAVTCSLPSQQNVTQLLLSELLVSTEGGASSEIGGWESRKSLSWLAPALLTEPCKRPIGGLRSLYHCTVKAAMRYLRPPLSLPDPAPSTLCRAILVLSVVAQSSQPGRATRPEVLSALRRIKGGSSVFILCQKNKLHYYYSLSFYSRLSHWRRSSCDVA